MLNIKWSIWLAQSIVVSIMVWWESGCDSLNVYWLAQNLRMMGVQWDLSFTRWKTTEKDGKLLHQISLSLGNAIVSERFHTLQWE